MSGKGNNASQKKKTQQAQRLKVLEQQAESGPSGKNLKKWAKSTKKKRPSQRQPSGKNLEDSAAKVIRAVNSMRDMGKKGGNLRINGTVVPHSHYANAIVTLLDKAKEVSSVTTKAIPDGNAYYRGYEQEQTGGGPKRGVPYREIKGPLSDPMADMLHKGKVGSPLTRPYYDVISVRKVEGNKNYVHKYDENFQKAVQSYIKHVHPSRQLGELNSLQMVSPFSLIDPFRSKLTGSVNYGYADLMRFLGWNYNKNETNIRKSKNNPFYQPIIYPQPDARGNAALLKMQQMYNYSDLINKLQHRFVDVNSKYMKDPKKHRVSRNKEFLDIAKILIKIIEEKTSPIYLSRFVGEQERPMHQYVHKHLLEDLVKFNQMHKLHMSSKGQHAPRSTKLRLTNKNLA